MKLFMEEAKHVNGEKGYMVASLVRMPKIKIKVTSRLILHHQMVNFSNLIFDLDHLNPTNMLVVLIGVFEPSIKVSYLWMSL